MAPTIKWLRAVLTGHMNYHRVPGNGESVSQFHYELVQRWFKMLRRRSQRYTITWEVFGPKARRWLPEVHVAHPYPEMRFRAKHLK